MTLEFNRVSYPIARKEHFGVDVWYNFESLTAYALDPDNQPRRDETGKIINCLNPVEAEALGLTDDGIAIVNQAMAENFRIATGEKYYRFTGSYDGTFFVYKCPLQVYEIIVKYELYPEDY